MTNRPYYTRWMVVWGYCLVLLLGLVGQLQAVVNLEQDQAAGEGTRPASLEQLVARRLGSFGEERTPGQEKPRYAKGQLIVKYKDSVTACVHCLLNLKRPFHSATTDHSDSLDQLRQKYQVKAAKPIFRTDLEEDRLRGKVASISLKQLKEYHQKKVEAVKAKFPQRTKRAPKDTVTPDLSHIYLLEVPEETNIEQAVVEFANDPHVGYAQPNYLAEVLFVPNDPYYHSSNSWGQGYEDLWGLKKMQAEVAWDVSQGQGIVVGVVDTGLDYTHPDIVANVWTNPGEIPANGLDDDGNGYIDDVHGFDFGNSVDANLDGDYTDPGDVNDPDPMDREGHGTHVAGTIAAVGNNGLGVLGVAPQAKILSAKAFKDGDGSTTMDQLSQAIHYAVDNGADVINNSWGCPAACPTDQAAELAVQYAYGHGVVVVFAAGNSNDDVMVRSPQNQPETIVVSAFDHNDLRASFSSFGSKIDVAAPGGDSTPAGSGPPYADINILSLRAAGTDMYCDIRQPQTCGTMDVGNDYYRARGTSMASPHVAGVAALILATHPGWDPEAVRQAIRFGADDVMVPGWDLESGYGRVNAYKAVTLDNVCVAKITQPAPYAELSGSSIAVKGSAYCVDTDFLDYRLEFGIGAELVEWSPVAEGTAQVFNGVLQDILPTADLEVMQEYQLRLLVRDTGGRTFEDRILLKKSPPQKPGWPKFFQIGPIGSAALELQPDGTRTLVFAEDNGDVTAAILHHLSVNGEELVGYPVSVSNPTRRMTNHTITIDDVDRSSNGHEIAVMLSSSSVHQLNLFSNAGELIQRFDLGQMGFEIFEHAIASADIDQDGEVELLTRNRSGIQIFRAGGLIRTVPLPSNVHTAAIVANLDADDDLEIVATQERRDSDTGTYPIWVHAFNDDGTLLPGWPVQVSEGFINPASSFGQVSAVDIDADQKDELVVAADTPDGGFLLSILNHQGQALPGWPQRLGRWVSPPFPAIGDIDGDGSVEVVVGTAWELYAFEADGTLVSGFPTGGIGLPLNVPVLADIDGDRKQEIFLIGAISSQLYGFYGNGRRIPSFPILITPSSYASPPVIGDLDNNGQLEIVTLGGWPPAPVSIFEFPKPTRTVPHWPTYLYNAKRTGRFIGVILEPIGNKTVSEGQLLTFTASANGPEGVALTWKLGSLPDVNLDGAIDWADAERVFDFFAQFADTPEKQRADLNSDGVINLEDVFLIRQSLPMYEGNERFELATTTFSWTPTYEEAGTYEVTFTVSDGSLSDSETITITVLDDPDADDDGFPDTIEQAIGTDWLAACPATTTVNDEPLDAWPPDFNDDRTVDGSDLFLFAQRFGTQQGVPPPIGKEPYAPRFDLYPVDASKGTIDGSDLFVLAQYFGKSCTP